MPKRVSDTDLSPGRWLPALLAGVVAGVSLPPQGWPWLLWPALAVVWRQCSARNQALVTGALFGGAAVLVSHRWLLALHPIDWLGVPLPLSLPLVVVLWLTCGALAATLVAAWGHLVARLSPITASKAIFLSSLWGLSEVMLARSPLFWLGAGASSLPGDRPLSGLAGFVGAGGLAAIQLFIGWTLSGCCPLDRALKRGLPLVAAVAILHALGSWALSQAEAPPSPAAVKTQGEEVMTVLAYQPAVPTREKFSFHQQQQIQRGLARAQSVGQAREIDVIVAPEGLLAVDQARPAPWYGELLSGGFRRTSTGLRSSLLRFKAAQPEPSQAVDKHRLVLLGEWVPSTRWWRWPGLSAVGGVEPGEPSRLLKRPGADAAIAICYEISDGDSLAAAVRQGAGWLLGLANLDPYPNLLKGQFQALVQLRAIETARPAVVVANTGPTGAFSPSGAAGPVLGSEDSGLLAMTIEPRSGLSLYARLGPWPLLAVVAVSGLVVGSGSIRPPPIRRSPS